MNFLDYWDTRIDGFQKNKIAIFNKPAFMNELHNEALKAWETALAEKEKECAKYRKALLTISVLIPDAAMKDAAVVAKQALEGKQHGTL